METADGGPHSESTAWHGRSARSQSLELLRCLWRSFYRLKIALLAGGIVAILIGNMIGQVRLNQWHGSFFDALAQRNLFGLGHQLLIFFAIIAVLLALVVAQTWLQEMLKVRLREWLTHHLLDEWLVAGRAYRLGLAGQIGVNPDQRIEEDTRKLTELSASLAVGLLQASLLLISFIGILWVLSKKLVFVLDGHHFTIPGYMVWCAIAYALVGSLLTWRAGHPLIGLNAELYAREAELRFALVRVSESAESIALFGGEQDERRQLTGILDRVIFTMRRLSGSRSRLTWITSGYGWIAIVVPVVVASPGYFNGGLTIGGLMMVVGAFNHVQGSLRWFVDQFPAIADWRATLHRVSAFKTAVDTVDEVDDQTEHIRLEPHPEGKLAFDNVSVVFADGRVVVAEATVEIGPGERVLMVGEFRCRQEHAVPRACRLVEVGQRHHLASRPACHDVHAAKAIHAARDIARRHCLPRPARCLRRRRHQGGGAEGGPRRLPAHARCRGAPGQATLARRAAARRLCPPVAAPPGVDLPR